MKHRVVLYNPQASFFTMPLALVAIGSRLDPARYDVRIVDGRLETAPTAAVLNEIDDRTVCVGMTVLTGAPIRDALRVTAAIRRYRPGLPIVWGGWHPSLFPAETLAEAQVDAVVIGQGEEPFAHIVERLTEAGPRPPDPGPHSLGSCLSGIPGTAVSVSDAEGYPTVVRDAPQPLVDLNRLPAHNYELIPVERYFAQKRQRQLDYISSQGCRFRCTFCADPSVYGRGWSGLEPERMADELDSHWRRYDVRDVGFQDETFFTSAKRVAAIAEAFLRRGLRFSWMATMRADQGARLDERVLADCRRAGLRRVMIGVEAGSQPMLDWMKKDITIDQVLDSAAKCARGGVAVLFNLIVGFPNESEESVAATLQMGMRLRTMHPSFEVSVFYYRPYPGNPITDQLERSGVQLPRTLEEWAAFEDQPSSSAWVNRQRRLRVERFRFYQRLGWSHPSLWRRPIQALARWRCRTDRYGFPVEKVLLERLRPNVTT